MLKPDIFQAIALEVPDDNESPPKLSARGEFEIAQHIIACAKKYGVPIVEKPQLCEALGSLELDQQIPTELFQAAAAVLAEVGALRRTVPSRT